MLVGQASLLGMVDREISSVQWIGSSRINIGKLVPGIAESGQCIHVPLIFPKGLHHATVSSCAGVTNRADAATKVDGGDFRRHATVECHVRGDGTGSRLSLKEIMMLKVSHAGRHMPFATALIALAAMASSLPAYAGPACSSFKAPVLEIQAVDCQQEGVWSQLRVSQRFPDVFAGTGKTTNICYMSTGPAAASIGNTKVTIVSALSGWTTDFVPVPYGGTDNLASVVTQISITGLHGNSRTTLYTRDTIDFSQIFTTGTAPEEDVIVGGSAALSKAGGTIRALATPEDASASKVKLTNLDGEICP